MGESDLSGFSFVLIRLQQCFGLGDSDLFDTASSLGSRGAVLDSKLAHLIMTWDLLITRYANPMRRRRRRRAGGGPRAMPAAAGPGRGAE